MSFKNIYLLACTLLCTVFTMQPEATSLYHQLCPEILRPVNIQEPSQSDQILINACISLQQHGTQQATITPDIWDAIKSIDMYSDILPKYSRTQTLSGYIALCKQVAQMTDNLAQLQAKTQLTTYLTSKPAVQERMNKLIAQAGSAESFFFHLFRNISQEEQEELDKIHKKLYFSNPMLEKINLLEMLNESKAGLEVGPRLNQLYTLAWYTVPTIMASGKYGQFKYSYEQATLDAKENILTYANQDKSIIESNLEEAKNDKKNLVKDLEADPNNPVKKIKIISINATIENLEKYSKLSPEEISQQLAALPAERNALIAKKDSYASIDPFLNSFIKSTKESFNKLPIEEQASQDQWVIREFLEEADAREKFQTQNPGKPYYSNRLMYLADNISKIDTITKIHVPFYQDIFKKGLYKLPESIFDLTTKGIPGIAKGLKFCVTERPLYYLFKEDILKKWDQKAYSTMAAAAGAEALYCALFLSLPALYVYQLYSRYHATKDLMTLIHEKQQQLIIMGHWAKSMQLLCATIGHDNNLKNLMGQEFTALSELFNPKSKATSTDLKLLIETLLSSSFQGSDSFMLSQQGKILATHHLLLRIKGQLVPYFEVQGQIDAKLSVAKLYQEFQNHPRVTFCLPSFIDAATPSMDATEYWHPLINPDFVVPNSLTMGNNNIKNLMITGPNAGGKTTSLMSLIINIIFAQSLGIAPSKTLTITPFAKIHSYLDITTNLQEGLSLFAAEVDRAKKLKQSILSCTPGQKTFTIIDEIFSGTNPQVASDVGYTFAAQLGEMTHSMTIITTHFPRLTDIEKEVGTFINYKVADATIMPDGKVVYPFKLIPGISTQNIAQHMLEQQGII